jgi:hypothetical protein
MEIERSTFDFNESTPKINISRAPIAQEEIHDDEFADEYLNLPISSSSPCLIQSTQRSESMIVHIGECSRSRHGRRRKRKQDPFGNLILFTKKMKLNDIGNENDKQVIYNYNNF